MKTYTRDQLISLRKLLERDEEVTNKIEEGMGIMFEDQYKPFMIFYNLLDVVAILDPELDNVLNYMRYEARQMDGGGCIEYPDERGTNKLTPDVEGFIKYCDLEGILSK